MDNSSDFRVYLFTQIHEILFHSQGGYDYDTVYNMPIWLRKFTFNKLKEYYTPKDNKNESSWTQGDVKEEASKNKQIKVPTYVTKASKK